MYYTKQINHRRHSTIIVYNTFMFLNNSDLLAFRFLTMKLIFMCRCVCLDYSGRCSFINPCEKSGCKSVWKKLIVGKPLQSTYHNGLSVQVGLKIWHNAGGKYLQVGPLQPSLARHCPDHRCTRVVSFCV